MSGYVYILTNKPRSVLYTGVTSDLPSRMQQHREEINKGFTARYHIHRLVYHEQSEDVYAAIQREKQIKKWNRAWKIRLIEAHNPEWIDLFDGFEVKQLPIP